MTTRGAVKVALLAFGALEIGALVAIALVRGSPAPRSPGYGDPFWKHWGDGRAELAGYDLTFTRYGEPRRGVAVAIFVTETFSNSLRVKADPGKHAKSDEFPVMKLNLVRDFPTGIYDYNLMTSAFVALAPVNGLPAGTPTKISFSSQEWCGNVFSQALVDRDRARLTLHSYFDGEADRSETLPLREGSQVPAGAIAEDALPIWARGLAWPELASGESREVSVLRSLAFSRLHHVPMAWEKARLTRERATRRVTVPAGTFDAQVCTAEIPGELGSRTRTFFVEREEPHRLLRWECSDGEQASLLASDRLEYWKMNGPGFRDAVRKLGLAPRPERTP